MKKSFKSQFESIQDLIENNIKSIESLIEQSANLEGIINKMQDKDNKGNLEGVRSNMIDSINSLIKHTKELVEAHHKLAENVAEIV